MSSLLVQNIRMRDNRPSRPHKKRVMFQKSERSYNQYDWCPVLSLRMIRFCRRPVSIFLLKLAFFVFLVTSSFILVLNYDQQQMEYKNYLSYHQCEIVFLQVLNSKKVLDPVHACAVESAALAHPNRTVCLAMASVSPGNPHQWQEAKNQFSTVENVFVLPLDFDAIFKWTPLESWWKEDFKYAHSPWRTVHLADAVRLAFVWKYGGLYLDLDSLVLEPFYDLEQNILGIQYFSGDDGINTAVLKFERNHPFLSKWLFTVPGKYQEGERASIGPLLATKLIFPYCQGDPPERKLEALAGKYCDYDLKIVGPEWFYPIPWPDWKSIFRSDASPSVKTTLQKINGSKVVHLWNELSSRLGPTEISKDSVFMQLARQKCPGSYYLYFHNLDRDKLSDHEYRRFLQLKIKAQQKSGKY